MDNNREIVGWVLVDDAARVLVRQASSVESHEIVSAEEAFEHVAIRSGSFKRHRIIDQVTRDVLVSDID